MSYQITERCSQSGECVSVCPTQSIYFVSKNFVIDADSCADCALCVQVCPSGAVVLIPQEVEQGQRSG